MAVGVAAAVAVGVSFRMRDYGSSISLEATPVLLRERRSHTHRRAGHRADRVVCLLLLFFFAQAHEHLGF